MIIDAFIVNIGCGKANVGFLIDTSSGATRSFLQKMVFNYIRLFQLQGTYVSIYAYGANQQRITNWKSFASPQEIQVGRQFIIDVDYLKWRDVLLNQIGIEIIPLYKTERVYLHFLKAYAGIR